MTLSDFNQLVNQKPDVLLSYINRLEQVHHMEATFDKINSEVCPMCGHPNTAGPNG